MPTIPVASDSSTSDELDPRRSPSVAVVKFLLRHAFPILSVCIAIAIAVNIAAPFWTVFVTHNDTPPVVAPGSQPVDGPSFLAADNVAYVVVDSARAGSETDTYVDALVQRLRSSAVTGVRRVINESADPLTASIARSDDDHVTYFGIELAGEPGSSAAVSATAGVCKLVATVPAPDGIHAYVSGPGAATAEVVRAAPLLSLLVLAALVIFIVATASCSAVAATALASSAVALIIALPIHVLFAPYNVVPSGAVVTVTLTMGTALYCSQLMASCYRRRRRHQLTVDAALAATWQLDAPLLASSVSVVVLTLCAVAAVGSTPVAAGAIAAAVGTAIAAILCCASAAAWMPHVTSDARSVLSRQACLGLSRRLTMAVCRHPAVSLVVSALFVGGAATQLSGLGTVLAHPQTAPVNSPVALGYAAVAQHFPDDRLRPVSVDILADHDLRKSSGLLAIERVTRQLMELPEATRVQSAAWPAGVPWPKATVAHQIGELNEQLQHEGLTGMSLAASVERLPSTIEEMTKTIDQLENTITAGSARLSSVSTALINVRSATNRIETTLTALSDYADPVRNFIHANPNCAADMLCASAQRIIEPVDGVLADTSSIIASVKTLPDTISSAGPLLTAESSTLSRLRANLSQSRTVVDEFASMARDALPKATKVSTFINTMTADLSGSGESGFYLTQAQIDAPDYDQVRAHMFSADGHATRILVYINGIDPSDKHLASAAAAAVRQATKFGDLASAAISIKSAGTSDPVPVRQVRDLIFPTLVLAAVISLAVGLATRSAAAGLAVAAATLMCVAAGLGTATSFASILPVRTDWSHPLLAGLLALPVVAEDGFRLVGRWVGMRHPTTGRMHRACPRNSMLSASAAVAAVVVTATAAVTGSTLIYGGIATLFCLAISYAAMRTWLIVAITKRTAKAVAAL